MFAGICVGGWDRGVGEVVVFSMGTRLLTASTEKKEKGYVNIQIRNLAAIPFNESKTISSQLHQEMHLPAMMSSSVSVSVCAGVATMSPSGAC